MLEQLQELNTKLRKKVDPTVSSKSSSGYPTRYSGHRASHITRAPSARYPVHLRTSSSRARHAQLVPFHLCSALGNDGMSATLETAWAKSTTFTPAPRSSSGAMLEAVTTVIVLEATTGPKIIDAEGSGKPNRRQWPLLTPKFGKESDLWVRFEKESVWRKEGYFQRFRQRDLRSAICSGSAKEQ
jgi:hypothetical protein